MTAVSGRMCERPILFSGPMVRAILEKRKTKTRRVIADANSEGNYRASDLLLDDPRTFVDGGPSPAGNGGPYLHAYVNAPAVEKRHGWSAGDCDPEIMDRLYPRYQVGDRLWVRETFQVASNYHADGRDQQPPFNDGRPVLRNDDADYPHWQQCYYAASDPCPELMGVDDDAIHQTWKPSIHMPRWASRLSLEITDVRVERLQEITPGDCEAEGIVGNQTEPDILAWSRSVRRQYRELWDSLNAKRGYGWDANPWVWAISFRRIDG